jgi:hypothetical protein
MGLRTFKLLPLEDIQQVEARALGSGMLEHDERTARWPFIIFGKVFGSYSLGLLHFVHSLGQDIWPNQAMNAPSRYTYDLGNALPSCLHSKGLPI